MDYRLWTKEEERSGYSKFNAAYIVFGYFSVFGLHELTTSHDISKIYDITFSRRTQLRHKKYFNTFCETSEFSHKTGGQLML